MKNLIWLFTLLVFQGADAQFNVQQAYRKWNTDNFRQCPALRKQVQLKDMDIRLLNAAIFWVSNEQRIRNNRTALNYADPLETAAFLHARYLATNRILSHENTLDERRRTPQDRARLAGIQNPYIAENCLYNTHLKGSLNYLELADKLVGIWMNSPNHRNTLLSDHALSLGCGVFINQDQIYAAQSFQFYEPIRVDEENRFDKFPRQ